MEDIRSVFYDHYESFKESAWDEKADAFLKELFAIEFGRANAQKGHKVLELGFGNGRLLDWGKDQGYEMSGMETVDTMVASAKERGHEAWHGNRPEDTIPQDRTFDLIVAIDVFEHLTTEELLDTMKFCSRACTPSGKVLARFPNGNSPFSAPLQNGDATHMSTLTPKKIGQIAAIHGFRVAGAYNAARPTKGGNRSPWVRKLGYLARDLIGNTLCMVFHGKKFPMDANITVVLERAPSPSS